MEIFHLTMNDPTSFTFGHSTPSCFYHRVDQVLYAEMVLPDGQFVRFGPSTWTPAEGNQLYPQTTSVKGYCITDDTADLSDESTWSWVDCTDQYGFDDLWFAIRGGGGGNYGVITSIYYQLHDKPGNLQQVYWAETLIGGIDPSLSAEEKGTMMAEMLKFVYKFLYKPEFVGVSVDVSNSCSAPEQFSLDCYNGAGQAFVDAWEEYFGMLETANMISGAAPTPRMEESSSYAATAAASHYNGRVQDGPKGEVLYGGDNALVIPIDVLKNKFDAFMDLYIPCVFDTLEAFFVTGTPETMCLGAFTPYFYGGEIQFASDGTDAYPPHRRNGALHMYVLQKDVREQFKKLIWNVEENVETYSNGDFPGLYCHNHLSFSTSPKKSNWLEDCIRSTPDGSGLTDDDCFSLQEAAFGTETLRRLEKIHSDIDPLRMFQTSDGPGYAEGGADTSSAGVYLTIISVFVTLSTTLILI